MNDRFLSLLGLMRKAGRLSLGFDSAKESILNGKSKLLLISCDISPKSEKELMFFASAGSVPLRTTNYTCSDFKEAIGRGVKIISITDEGFAARALKFLDSKQSGEE